MYGRKHILKEADEQNKEETGPHPAKVPKMSSTVIAEELPQLKGVSQQISSKNITVRTEKLNQSEDFKSNVDFLDYLRSYEIKNRRDASFIHRITRNCTKALMTFREEQTKIQISYKESNSDPKNDINRSDRAECSSINSPKKCSTAAHIPPIFQNRSQATEQFFKSIKNMNATEVIGVLKKIATSNPAFQGIHIPSIMKYLQETGRLKKS